MGVIVFICVRRLRNHCVRLETAVWVLFFDNVFVSVFVHVSVVVLVVVIFLVSVFANVLVVIAIVVAVVMCSPVLHIPSRLIMLEHRGGRTKLQ